MTRTLILIIALAMPAGAQWTVDAGLESGEGLNPGIVASVNRTFGRVGWAGEFGMAREERTVTRRTETRLRDRWIRDHKVSERAVTVDDMAYRALSGPNVRLYSWGQAVVRCRGLAGTARMDAQTGWRVAARAGCFVTYAFDTQAGLRFHADYEYVSPGRHVPVLGLRLVVGF